MEYNIRITDPIEETDLDEIVSCLNVQFPDLQIEAEQVTTEDDEEN